MNLQSLVVVVLRLMSLNFLLQLAIQLAPQLFRLTDLYQRGAASNPAILALPWLVLNGLLVGAVLLWVCALPIARMVTQGVPHDLSLGSLSLGDCYSMAFLGMGLFYIAGYFSPALNWTHYLFKTAASQPGSSWKEGMQWYEVSQAILPFIIGVVLFVNGRKWALVLARRQAFGEQREADEAKN